MKKIFLFAFLTAVGFGCEEESGCPVSGLDPIALSAEIVDQQLSSKTTITGSTAAWKDGDALGLFCTQSKPVAANVSFTASNLSTTAVWTPATALYWADGTTAHTFLAYAPFASGNSSAATVKLPALNVQTGTVDPAFDFLLSNNLASPGVNRSGGAVGLLFTHALTLIQFDITIGNGVASGATLTNFTLVAGASDKLLTTDATSTIALSTGVITPATTTNTITVTPASAPTLSGTAGTVYALILPGTFTSPTLQITLSEGGTAINVPAKPLVTTSFSPATKYTYTVNVTRTAITISTPIITDWGTGTGGAINPGI